MTITILGPESANCTTLLKRATKAAEQLGVDASVEFDDDPEHFWSFGIMDPPVLVIDGRIDTRGEVPTIQRLKTLIQRFTEPPATGHQFAGRGHTKPNKDHHRVY